MEYRIITDQSNTLVLIFNTRIIAISNDMSEITRLITEDYGHHLNKTRRSYNPILWYPELDKENIEKPYITTLPNTDDENPSNGSLKGMFNL